MQSYIKLDPEEVKLSLAEAEQVYEKDNFIRSLKLEMQWLQNNFILKLGSNWRGKFNK
jgi:hypothetical protein